MVNEKKSAEREFSLIKEGLKLNKARIAEALKQRVGPGEWELAETDVPVEVEGEKETIDMVFTCETGRNSKKLSYILVDVSVPHLGIGQKYALPAKGKIFQTERDIPSNRLKKAIILIRCGTDGVKALPARIRCPIIDVQLENIVAKRSENKSQSKTAQKQAKVKNDSVIKGETKEEIKNEVKATLTSDMLFALKEAVVHDYISTSYKRSNKYVFRGLWKWVEREIMDPNVHFFFIILSSIYQGKTGEILSKKFRTLDSLIEVPEEVVNAIFSRENPIVDDIKKDIERHKKAITKLLLCFSQTSPFEYLKSIFLKEFRTSADSTKSRMCVYNTLQQLLERCGFEGEKEVAYPLEILDELKIFREILCGDYSKLRIDNAYKKLKHLIPQIEWTSEEIYKLRKELAKTFSIPENEFNLNAYLPQAFYQDAKNIVEQKRENMRSDSEKLPVKKEQPAVQEIVEKAKETESADDEQIIVKKHVPTKVTDDNKRIAKRIEKDFSAEESDENSSEMPVKRSVKQASGDYEMPPKKRKRSDEVESAYEAAMQAERMLTNGGEQSSEEPKREEENGQNAVAAEQENESIEFVETDEEIDNSDSEEYDDSEDIENSECENDEQEQEQEQNEESKVRELDSNEYYEYDLYGDKIKAYKRGDCDESRHRNFESFGGVMIDDMDAMKMAIAMTNYEIERLARAARTPKISDEEKEAMELEAEERFMPPVKKVPGRNGTMPVRPSYRSENSGHRFAGDLDNMHSQRHISGGEEHNGTRRTFGNRDNKRNNNQRNNQQKRYYNNNRRNYSGGNRQNNRRGR